MSMIRNIFLLLALPLAAHAQINNDYRIEGSGEARPVQVFDDGANLYVQVRDPMHVPAPIAPSGPVAFQIRGHYLVMPLMHSFRLQLGDSVVSVTGRGASRLPEGVVSMTRPVEAVELPEPPVMIQPAPVVAMPAAAPSDEVTGEIEVAGSAVAGVAPPRRGRQVPIAAADAEIQRVLIDVPASTPIDVRADGTVEGATAARRVMRVCEWAGRACSLQFKGADRGYVQVEPKA